MSELFGSTLGIDILAPRKLAIESGRAASEAVSRGFQIAQGNRRLDMAEKEISQQEKMMEVAALQNSKMLSDFNTAARGDDGQVDPDKAFEFFKNNSHLAVNPFTTKGFTALMDVTGKLQRAKLATLDLEAKTIAGKVALADTVEFRKRMSALDPILRAEVNQITPSEDGRITKAQWDSLSLAEQTVAARQQADMARREIEARERGMDTRIAIGPKGVTTTYTEPKPEKVEAYPIPTEVEIGGQKFLGYKNFALVPLTQNNMELRTRIKLQTDKINQLRSKILTGTLSTDEANAANAKIDESTKEIEKLFSSTPTSPAVNSPSAPSPAKRVRVRGPNGQTGTVIEGESLPQGWSLE